MTALALQHGAGRRAPCRDGFPLHPLSRQGDFFIALPPLSADAAANDRFPVQLSRARLAVAHPSVSPVPSIKVRQSKLRVAFDRREFLNENARD